MYIQLIYIIQLYSATLVMFSSIEIRWFRRQPMPLLFDWFHDNGANWEDTSERVDYYQALPREDLGIKLREGSVESKLRVKDPVAFTLQEGYEGFRDEWEKFSFRISADDRESPEILRDGYPRKWIAVRKRRMGIKATRANDGWELLPMSQFPANGIQLEYTEIEKEGIVYFSFCLESFGDNCPALESWSLPLPSEVQLTSAESYSYPRFLLQ